jgi:protein required for attachment to host cells
MPLNEEQQRIFDEAMRVKPRDELAEWRAYHDEKDAARERETRRRQRAEARTARAMVETADADWNAWAATHVQRGIDAYHEMMIAAVGEVLGELREEFDEKLSALRRELTGKSAVVDMSERRRV